MHHLTPLYQHCSDYLRNACLEMQRPLQNIFFKVRSESLKIQLRVQFGEQKTLDRTL